MSEPVYTISSAPREGGHHGGDQHQPVAKEMTSKLPVRSARKARLLLPFGVDA